MNRDAYAEVEETIGDAKLAIAALVDACEDVLEGIECRVNKNGTPPMKRCDCWGCLTTQKILDALKLAEERKP